jgi:hypothetical protein
MYARRAFGLQSEELSQLKQDRKDQQALNRQQVEVLALWARELRASLGERELTAARERDAQARQVFASQQHFTGDQDPRISQVQRAVIGGKPVVAVTVNNSSSEPISDIRVNWHLASAPEGAPDLVDRMMPGEEKTLYREPPANAVYGTLGADVQFRDARGVTWRRTLADGALTEVGPGEGAEAS